MERTEVYIIFPEYCEPGEKPSGIYLQEGDLLTDDDVRRRLGYFQKMTQYLSQENYNGFYDSRNVQRFIKPMEHLPDCYPNRATALRRALQHWSDWRVGKKQPDDWHISLWESRLMDETIAEICWRREKEGLKSYLIVDNGKSLLARTEKVISASGKIHRLRREKCSQTWEILKWFTMRRIPARNFHLLKHGECGTGAWPGPKVSKLNCTEEEARKMLHKALGRDRHRLWYYDKTRKQYIEFRYENDTPQNLYHGFHLSALDSQRVPHEIKKRLAEIYKAPKP